MIKCHHLERFLFWNNYTHWKLRKYIEGVLQSVAPSYNILRNVLITTLNQETDIGTILLSCHIHISQFLMHSFVYVFNSLQFVNISCLGSFNCHHNQDVVLFQHCQEMSAIVPSFPISPGPIYWQPFICSLPL